MNSTKIRMFDSYYLNCVKHFTLTLPANRFLALFLHSTSRRILPYSKTNLVNLAKSVDYALYTEEEGHKYNNKTAHSFKSFFSLTIKKIIIKYFFVSSKNYSYDD